MGHCVSNSNFRCPRCGFMPSNKGHSTSMSSLRDHQCIKPKPMLQNKIREKISVAKLHELRSKAVSDDENQIKIKVPVDDSNTIFKWIQQSVLNYPSEIAKLPIQIIKKGSFQEKLAWFRYHMESISHQWHQGSQLIKIDRQNLIQSSFEAINKVNLFKQIKVQFIDDHAQDAGGGLLRQWMHLCVKEIMSEELGIFKLANTDETAYQIVWSNTVSDESSFQSLNLLGRIIGKAILEKISLGCSLDRTILRQICSQPIHLSDVYSYDKAFYHSWQNILNMPNIEDLCLDGTIYHKFSGENTQEIEVFPNGKNILITENNKKMYIAEMINLYCTKSIESQLDQLCKAIYSIVPAELLSIFQPHEFQMLLNGPNIIDIQDLKNNTVYDAYQADDQVIEWFWEIVEKYDQEAYRNLLHYVTGSARVPIMGFAKLETSHGHIKKFTIRKIKYNSQNPYPKSYTCFNRLDLPEYSTKQEMSRRLAFIMQEEFTYFGLC